jgi:tripartite-type tricarboxylate transporter receptor subunit TctC
MAEINIRLVSYNGVVAALPDLLAGRVSMMFCPVSTILPAARDGRLHALAIGSLKRTPALPGVPTMAESGLPGFDSTVWMGLMAPAATPSPIIGLLYRASAKALLASEIREKLDTLGMEVIGSTPEEFAAVIESETPFWAKLIREAKIEAE